jgi:predicted metalloprotease with PDZ domain
MPTIPPILWKSLAKSSIPWVAIASFAVPPAAGQETVRYVVRVDEPASQIVHVEAEMPAGSGETVVSLPAWSPGHYVILNYARHVQSFAARDGSGNPLRWEKVDKDTWRIATPAGGTVTLLYDVRADTVNLSGSMLKDDFGFVNGTNLFVYPEERYDFASTVRFELPAGWRIATELEDGGAPATYRAASYDELVDAPTFLGHFGIDSLQADGVWIRLAIYPPDRIDSEYARRSLATLQRIADYLHDFFPGGPPYDRYTTLVYIEEGPLEWGGGLEHADSHLDILQADFLADLEVPFLTSLLSHEYFHAWNVKRIRPAEMWPYDYDEEQFTPLLWVSEGITDYYADMILGRTGVWTADQVWAQFAGAMANVAAVPEASVEDTSLDAWIDPVYAPGNYYYDKGKLIGLLFDAMIRDATEGANSLDDVMVRLYQEHYQKGRGFMTDDFLSYVGGYIGEDRARDFHRRHIDGREPLPYAELLAPIGLAYHADSVAVPFVGVGLEVDPDGAIAVMEVVPGSPAQEASLQPGDVLLSVGDVPTTDIDWGAAFRERYAEAEGEPLTIRYRRDGEERTGTTAVRTRSRLEVRFEPMADAPERARRLREGILAP